jgi:hypothetical protein
MLDTATGEIEKRTLKHEENIVREFYSKLPGPVRVGIEATGSMQWLVNLMKELGSECLVGHPAEIRAAEPRKQKHDRRDADLLLSLLVEERFPSIWLPTKELLDNSGPVAASTPVGGPAGQNTKCAAGDGLGKRPKTRFLPMDAGRATGDRVFAVVTPCRLSAE